MAERRVTERRVAQRQGRSASVSVAAGVTTLAVAAATIVVLTAPAALWVSLPFAGLALPPGAGSAAAAAMIGFAGWRLVRASPDAGFTLWMVACLLAGVGAHDVAAAMAADLLAAGPALASPADLQARIFVAYADLFAASSLVATLWAAAPERALGRWVGVVGGVVVALTIIGAAARALAYPHPSSGAVDLSVVWRSGFALLAVWLIGATGSLRAAGLAHLAAGRPSSAPAAASSPLLVWTAVLATAAGVMAALARGLALDDLSLVLGPCLWLLVALVALRWSEVASWMALTVSLVMAAEVAIPVSALAGWALLLAATLTGWSALVVATPGLAASRGRAVALAIGALGALPLLLGADGGALAALVWTPSSGFPIDRLWTPALVFGPVAFAAMAVLRRRLVPAIAEAEAVAGEPFAPSRYVAALASEALTGQARIRAAAAEAERRRLASDLHADVLPGLARAAAAAEADGAPDALRERLRTVESDVRGLLAERRHVVLEELGLVEALEWLAGRAEEGRDLEATLEVDPATTDGRPPLAVERAAFRVAQLAVENAVRHADAAHLALMVLVSPKAIRLVVADDGRGFDPSAGSAGFGLADMRLQAADVGAHVEVASAPGEGTRVAFAWPR